MSDLPDNVSAAMFLRDGWPDVIVCKVLMKTGCIGIGIHRRHPLTPSLTPQEFDRLALANALANVSDSPPDYTKLQEHVAKQQAEAEERVRRQREIAEQHKLVCEYCKEVHDSRVACPEYVAYRAAAEARDGEPDDDLQASLGHPPHDDHSTVQPMMLPEQNPGYIKVK